VDLEIFATASRRYTGDIHNSSVVGLFMTPVAYAGFYAETCQSKGGSGRRSWQGITNNSARQRRRRGEMSRDSALRVAEDYGDEDDDMMRMMWISVLRK